MIASSASPAAWWAMSSSSGPLAPPSHPRHRCTSRRAARSSSAWRSRTHRSWAGPCERRPSSHFRDASSGTIEPATLSASSSNPVALARSAMLRSPWLRVVDPLSVGPTDPPTRLDHSVQWIGAGAGRAFKAYATDEIESLELWPRGVAVSARKRVLGGPRQRRQDSSSVPRLGQPAATAVRLHGRRSRINDRQARR